jgi:hypothetical protein
VPDRVPGVPFSAANSTEVGLFHFTENLIREKAGRDLKNEVQTRPVIADGDYITATLLLQPFHKFIPETFIRNSLVKTLKLK